MLGMFGLGFNRGGCHGMIHRSQSATSGNEGYKKPPHDYLCKRCDRPNHWSDDCYARDQVCKACKKLAITPVLARQGIGTQSLVQHKPTRVELTMR